MRTLYHNLPALTAFQDVAGASTSSRAKKYELKLYKLKSPMV